MSTAKQKEAAVVAERLRNHKLSSSDFKQPADVVRWFGAVQAQEFHAAKWALALRMSHATNVAVEDAFNRGEILRTHLLRPTRSEEHTSELQSLAYLVCRLLLEKKK